MLRGKSRVRSGRADQRSGGEEESTVPEVVDGGRGLREDGVEEADGLGPVPPAAEAREIRAVGAHGGRRRPGKERWMGWEDSRFGVRRREGSCHLCRLA